MTLTSQIVCSPNDCPGSRRILKDGPKLPSPPAEAAPFFTSISSRPRHARGRLECSTTLLKTPMFFADPHRLVQMLTNLIDNAIKFNREGGTVTIDHETAAVDIIRVTDTGEGIPPQHLDRLFERFYRVDRARSRKLGGTGLGLAIVKHLAKAHGGDVSVTSRLGEGSQFMIRLPRPSSKT